MVGCGRSDSFPDDARTRAADANVRAVWGKGLAELPTDTLVLLSAHNENIRNEYEWAFSLYHAQRYGRKVSFEWRSVGGGSSSIYAYIENVYGDANSGGTSNIDVLWGGGDFNFMSLARRGVLQPMQLPNDVLENVPPTLGASPLRDGNGLWIGAALSAFGYVYNADMLRRCRIAPPNGTWEDLGDARFANLIALADPTQSGSVAATYQMIARSGEDWPSGWAKLLQILANAKRFTDSAGTAASGPSLGESLVATCIDFYGAVREAEAPGQIIYVSPKGQTAFTADPIAILKNPPHPELAQRFVDFVMSPAGQALWALRVGEKDGPARSALGRQPIRADVYARYRESMLACIVDPFQAGQTMPLTGFRAEIDYGVLRDLVGAAAVDNASDLRAARAAILRAGSPPDLLAEFARLPDNVDTTAKMKDRSREMKNPVAREKVLTDWQKFFREKYRKIARGARRAQ